MEKSKRRPKNEAITFRSIFELVCFYKRWTKYLIELRSKPNLPNIYRLFRSWLGNSNVKDECRPLVYQNGNRAMQLLSCPMSIHHGARSTKMLYKVNHAGQSVYSSASFGEKPSSWQNAPTGPTTPQKHRVSNERNAK